MDETVIYLDDWNTVFRKIPKIINDRTYAIMNSSNNCVDLNNYTLLKSRLTSLMKDIGNFEYISHATGDQAIMSAITLSKKHLNIKHIYITREAYHGITLKSFRDKNLKFDDISIHELEMDCLESEINSCHSNSLMIIEPFLFFAKYGDEGTERIKRVVSNVKKKEMLLLLDEIRSGVFCTGSFIFSQRCLPINADFICFSKGLALGVPTSILSIKAGIFSQDIIKKEDKLKSCMSISEIAMQRANDLIEYYTNNSAFFTKAISSVTKRITEYFSPLVNTSIVKKVNISGLCCVFVFEENVKKAKLRLLWLYLLSKNIEARHTEDNLWFLNFALDSTDEEFCAVRDAIVEAIKLIEDN